MAKHASTGDPLAIKFNTSASNRDTSFDVLEKLVNKVSRQFLVAAPVGMTDTEAKFDDFKQHPTHPYALVMEGGDQSLQDVLDDIGPAGFCAPIPENQCRFIFESIIQALACVHSHGYTHHDVKARNFVRFFNGAYKLIDFDNCRSFADEQEMGFTSAEICPPEVAKCMTSRGKMLKSDPSMDMWALGCVLYQLTTHRYLLPDLASGWDQDEVYKRTNEEALEAWKKADDKAIRRLLDEHVKGGADNPAHELLVGLLHTNPKQRWSISDVQASTFLTGGATLTTILGESKKLNTKMDLVVAGIGDLQSRMVKLEDLPAQVRDGFSAVGSQISSFRRMVLSVHKAECPATFVIGPEFSMAESLELAAGTGGAAKQGLSQWTDGIAAIFKGELSLSEFGENLTHQRFKLRLVCESCGETQGEGYSVKQPKEWVTQMLPAMKVSLTIAKIANVGLGLAGCFFPGIPTIPDDLLERGSDVLAGLDCKSSAEDFGCIQGALDAGATGGDSFQKQVDAGVRQLHAFLDTADPTHTWAGLALLDLGEQQQGAAAAAGGGRSTATAGTNKHGSGSGGQGGEDQGASELPDSESVLWVCKSCLVGGSCNGAAPAAAGRGKAGSKGASGGGGAEEEVNRLKEGLRVRDVAVRLLVRELKGAGLAVPPLPPGVPGGGEGWSSEGGAGGRMLARLTGSFGRQSGSSGGAHTSLNDTARLQGQGGPGTAAAAGRKPPGTAAASAGKGMAAEGVGAAGPGGAKAAAGGSCLRLFGGASAVHPE